MEIIQASSTCNHLQMLRPFLHFPVPAFTPCFSLSFVANHKHPLRSTSHFFLSPNTTRNSSRNPLYITHSLLEDGTSDLATRVVEVDPFLAVKKKAMDISPELKGASIYLVGINSTMKSSLGKLLADSLRYYFFDSDSLVVEAAGGESAAKTFREIDEKGYRESETEVLKQLSSMGRLVVSSGNGAVQSATNLALLRHGILIWIDIPLDTIAREVVEDAIQFPTSEISTSVSYSEVLTQLIGLYKEMQGGYATADATISLQKVACQLGYDDLGAVTAEDMCLEVLKEIERMMRVKKLMEEAARPF